MALDANIANNILTQAGGIGASLGSSAITQTLNKSLFSKLGSVGGFLGGQVAGLIKNFLFTAKQPQHVYDPIWKLSRFTYNDGITPAGNLNNETTDDFAGKDQPKYKFNYTVSFAYRSTIKSALPSKASYGANETATENQDKMRSVAFGIKQASRPSPTVILQDVNFYNYRTKISTKVDYGAITLVFYDDVNNRAHDILATYLQTISPIANVSNPLYAGMYDVIAQGEVQDSTFPNVSSLGALNNSESLGPVQSITLTQMLPLRATGDSLTESSVQYIYMNPKIINMSLDDVDVTVSEVSTVSMTFVYDSVFINKVSSSSNSVTVTGTNSQVLSPLDKFVKGISSTLSPITSSSAVSSLSSSNSQFGAISGARGFIGF